MEHDWEARKLLLDLSEDVECQWWWNENAVHECALLWSELVSTVRSTDRDSERVATSASSEVDHLFWLSVVGPDVTSKRLQSDIDAGYAVISSVNGYNHESVERKVSRQEGGRYYLTDTNNSTADFVICTDPTPRQYEKEGLL